MELPQFYVLDIVIIKQNQLCYNYAPCCTTIKIIAHLVINPLYNDFELILAKVIVGIEQDCECRVPIFVSFMIRS